MRVLKEYSVQILSAVSLLLFMNIMYPIKLTIFFITFIALLYIKVKKYHSCFVITRYTNKNWKKEILSIVIMDSFLCGIILSMERVVDFSTYTSPVNFIPLFIIFFLFLSICSILLIFPFLDVIKPIFLIIIVICFSLTKLDIFYYFNLLVEPSYWQYKHLLNGILVYTIVLSALTLSFWNSPIVVKAKGNVK